MTRKLTSNPRPLTRGIHAATTLPFTIDRQIDEVALHRQLDHILVHDGITGLLVNGHAGENHLTSDAEKSHVVAMTKARTGPGIAIVSGVYSESSTLAAAQAELLAEAGADALLVFPCLAWATGVEHGAVMNHHRMIAEATSLPLMLYVAPITAGRLHYPSDLLAQLIDIPGVAGIKDGSWEVARSEELRDEVKTRRPEVLVYGSGDEHLMVNYLIGTEGSQVSLAAVIPEQICALWDASQLKDWDRARALHARIQPLARLIYSQAPASRATARLKACQKMLGLIGDAGLRSPLCAAPQEEYPPLERALNNALGA